ncbi:TPA: hypothetical protein ACRUL4_003154 [Legionella pneumophila]|nr:hypothetical protein [Legionella pneumophila]HAT2115967.1 hypothetical protein [Legionella pneumophila]HAT8721277.1 hypothetical protein [Legionella pneumophila]
MSSSKMEENHLVSQNREPSHDIKKKKEILYFDYRSGLLTDEKGNTYTPSEINNQLDDEIDFDIREQARKYIADLSNKIFQTTGQPLFKSLNYNGISAWWFLEIALHEPVFLRLRSQILLNKLRMDDRYFIFDKRSNHQPNSLPTSINELQGEFAATKIKLLKSKVIGFLIFRNLKVLFQNLFNYFFCKIKEIISHINRTFIFFFMKPKDILIFFENENLRTHYNFATKKLDDTLTYAEGIIEKIHMGARHKTIIFDRSRNNKKKFLWDFKVKKMPRTIPCAVPKQFVKVIEELFSYIFPLLKNEMPVSMMLEILAIKLQQFNEYNQLISKLKSKILFTYNWEGVFRPLIAAAKINNVKIIGVQQALGPYSHALNHQETGYWTSTNEDTLKFPIPDKYLVWGEFHQEQFIRKYGYPAEQVLVTGYARLDKHYYAKINKAQNRKFTAAALGINPNKRYLLFTVQYNVLNTCLVNKTDFESTLFELIKLGDLYNFDIIIKPWSGDNITYLMEQASKRPDKIHFAPQNVIIPNSYLLLLSDWCVSTFSSIIGEATLCGNLCFLINYFESKSYFETKHMSIYDKLTIKINSPSEVNSTLIPYLCSEDLSKEKTEEFTKHLYPIFGACDGQSADRASRIVLDSL